MNERGNGGEVRKGSVPGDILKFALLAVVIVLPVRMFIAQPFIVSGSSMDPTFATGQYLIVDEISYRFNDPVRGDVVILRYPRDPSKFFIKRIIGLPNETVEIREGVVTIMKGDGETITLDEEYVKYPKEDSSTRTLRDEYFVMGDNRAKSSDSRIWGPVPKRYIVGRALVRLFPIAYADINPGAYNPTPIQ